MEDHAGQRALCNLLAVVVAQRKTLGTKSERRVVAGEAGNRSIPQIIEMKHCLEEFFNLRLKDKVRIYWKYINCVKSIKKEKVLVGFDQGRLSVSAQKNCKNYLEGVTYYR
ncbi:MAG: hypothetical protein GQ542_18675 [Desulforhopalus sp.]|nr:hypothetical protein [Desulforhopalus sp.]